MSITADIGSVAVVPAGLGDAFINQHIALARPRPGVNSRYVAWFVASPEGQRQLTSLQRGATKKGLGLDDIRSIRVPWAPRHEQDRIVAEIEKQFTRLDAGVEALKRLQAHLRRYRAAVLKAACEGRLVPTEDSVARREARQYEPASSLLARVAEQRRSAHAAVHTRRYKDPAVPDTSSLPRLPCGWAWATIDALTTKVADGVHKTPKYVTEGIPFVTVKNLTAGPGLSFTDLKYIRAEDHKEYIKRTNPEAGDLLVSKDGTLGVVRVVPEGKEFSIFVSVALLKPVMKVMTPYLALALQSPQVQAQMVGKGTGLLHLHLEDLREDCVPIPPLAEQQRIVSEVEERLSQVEACDRILESALARSGRLCSSVLHAAFEGRLVA